MKHDRIKKVCRQIRCLYGRVEEYAQDEAFEELVGIRDLLASYVRDGGGVVAAEEECNPEDEGCTPGNPPNPPGPPEGP